MKKYMNPATEVVNLNGERMMVGVNQSQYNGEANAPERGLKYLK